MSAFESRKYSWRSGFSYGCSPQIVGEVLETIEERDGKVTPEAFLEESRPEDAETHKMFEWNDAIAAEKYRLDKAQRIIGGLTYTMVIDEDVHTKVTLVDEKDVVTVNESIKPYKAWINVSEKGRGRVGSPAVLVSFDRAMADKVMRQNALRNALSEVKMYTNKYRHIKEFSKIFTAIDEVEEHLL